MPKSFDYARARTELEEAARRRDILPLASTHPWVSRIRSFSREAESGAKTHIAMLGTALLAKATEPAADLSRLTIAPGSRGTYYARGLADVVLARVAPLLQIDLGAKGRNPLNNSPYRGPKTLAEARSRVRRSLLPIYDDLLRIIDDVGKLSESEAREALQAFVQVRTATAPPRQHVTISGARIALSALVRSITDFVEARPEGGKRAQAAAAGVLDGAFGPESISVGKINDPSIDWPGDVRILRNDKLVWSLEVRHKQVNLTDSLRFVRAIAQAGCQRAGILAVSSDQESISLQTLERQAEEAGVLLRVFTSWRSLAEEVVFHAPQRPDRIAIEIANRLLTRCYDLEVSAAGIAQWQDIILALNEG